MTYNFNDVENAFGGSVELQRIFGRGNILLWEKTKDISDYSKEYLTFEIYTSGTITWKTDLLNQYTGLMIQYWNPTDWNRYFSKVPSSFYEQHKKKIYYSINNGTWTEIWSGYTGSTINVSAGDIVRFKSDDAISLYSQYTSYSGSGWSSPLYVASHFSTTVSFNAYGNLNSIIIGDYFLDTSSDITVFPYTNYTGLCGLFQRCTGLMSAQNMIFPWINTGQASITNGHYKASTIESNNISRGDFYGLFGYCSNLRNGPFALPQTLNGQPNGLYYNCSKLSNIRALFTPIDFENSQEAYKNCYWVFGVSTVGKFIKASNENWPSGVNGIPTGWTVQNV